jgi:uncharacterized protein (DUF934 family)
MAVVITPGSAAQPEPVAATLVALDALLEGAETPAGPLALDYPNDRDPAELAPWLDRLALIRVAFPAMNDGRGFSIARRLRAMGYRGRLRAAGPLIADQATAARAVGFDEVETTDGVAARQPGTIWARPARRSYQARLAGG